MPQIQPGLQMGTPESLFGPQQNRFAQLVPSGQAGPQQVQQGAPAPSPQNNTYFDPSDPVWEQFQKDPKYAGVDFRDYMYSPIAAAPSDAQPYESYPGSNEWITPQDVGGPGKYNLSLTPEAVARREADAKKKKLQTALAGAALVGIPALMGVGGAGGAAAAGADAGTKAAAGVAKGAGAGIKTGATVGKLAPAATKAGAGAGGLFSKIGAGIKTATGGEGVGALDRIGNIFGKIGGDDSLFGKIMTGVNLAGGLGAAGGGNDLSDLLGLTDRNTTNMLKGAEFQAPNVNLPGGAGGTFDPATNTYSSKLGDLNPLRELLLGAGQTGRQDPAVAKALKDFGLGGFQDTADVEQQQLDLLRQRAAPQNQRNRNAGIENLFMRGRFGSNDSASGEVARGLAEAENSQDLDFQLAARDLGLKTQDQRFGQSMDSLGLGDKFDTTALARLLSQSQGAQDMTQFGGLPIEMMLALGQARSNSMNNVGSNIVANNQRQNSLGDLLGLYAANRGAA